jgi:acetylornithine deacetylase/succinyl-diaminopimelate desuccinylase-like protein
MVRTVQVPNGQVELLQALIRFDTSNPPGNERACIEFVGGLLQGVGLAPDYVALEPDRPNLVARVTGRGDAPPLLLYGHVDVVKADPREWSHPPFGGDLVGDEVWGRGAFDMKSGVAMLTSALLRVVSADAPPAGDVLLVLTSDEEAGSRTGMKFLVEQHPEIFAGVRYAVSEFGGYTLWRGGRRFVPIQVTEKQRCLIRGTVRGPAGHAASVVHAPATARLGSLLTRLDRRPLPAHVTDVARTMLESMRAALPLYERLFIRAVLTPELGKRLLRPFRTVASELIPFLCNTATPTVLTGGDTTNVIPSELSVELDGRILPGLSTADLIAELEELAGDLATFEIVSEEPAVPTAPDLSLFPLLAAVVGERDRGCVPIPMLLPGYTDARYVSKLGIQTYGFLPMRLPPHLGTKLVHAADERVPADAVEFGTECLVDVINRYR